MIIGTQVGAEFLKKATKNNWGTPLLAKEDDGSGSIMPEEGQLLYGFVRALKPETILEVGTSYGLSTLHLAAACKDNNFGKVYTVEIDHHRRYAAKYYAEQASVEDWIKFYEEIPTLEKVGFCFLDAEHTKNAVAQYLSVVKPMLAEDALVLVHDATWVNHVEEAAREQGFDYLILPNTSYAGLGILWQTTIQK